MCVQLYASASVQPFVLDAGVDQLPDMPVDLRRADIALPPAAEQMDDAVLVIWRQQRKITQTVKKVISEFLQYWALLIIALENERHEQHRCQHNCTGKDEIKYIHMASVLVHAAVGKAEQDAHDDEKNRVEYLSHAS